MFFSVLRICYNVLVLYELKFLFLFSFVTKIKILLLRACNPGDHVNVAGIYLPMKKDGYMSMVGGLTNETFIDAHSIVKINKQEDEEVDDEEMSEEELKELAQVYLHFKV